MDALEEELQFLYLTITSDWQNTKISNLIKSKEKEMMDLLKEEEYTWRQKSRAISLKSGDRNTKFFHHFANDQKNRK